MRIEIISGSTRKSSVSIRVAKHLQQKLQGLGNHEVGLLDVRDYHLPQLQQVFVSEEAAPAEFKELSHRIFAADAFILVSPEYNGSFTAGLKNLFDHFPKQQRKVFGIATASPGNLGGIRAALQMQQFVMALFGIASPYLFVVPQVDKKFDEGGNLLDTSFEKAVDTFLKELLWLSESLLPQANLIKNLN